MPEDVSTGSALVEKLKKIDWLKDAMSDTNDVRGRGKGQKIKVELIRYS